MMSGISPSASVVKKGVIALNVAEFINKCDYEGGLVPLFNKGVSPYQLENTTPLPFRANLYKAYEVWKEFKKYEDKYYQMCEDCMHES